MIPQSAYDQMYDMFLKGELSEEEWSDFCSLLLDDFLQKHKDILIRIKNNHPP